MFMFMFVLFVINIKNSKKKIDRKSLSYIDSETNMEIFVKSQNKNQTKYNTKYKKQNKTKQKITQNTKNKTKQNKK